MNREWKIWLKRLAFYFRIHLSSPGSFSRSGLMNLTPSRWARSGPFAGPALRAERDQKIRKDVRIESESQRSVHAASILLNAIVLLNKHLKLQIDWPVRSFCVLWAALWPFRRPSLRTCPGNYGMQCGNISVHLQPVGIYKISHKWYQRKINLPPVTTSLLLFPHSANLPNIL